MILKKIEEHQGETISGYEFNKLFNGETFIKMLNFWQLHDGLCYKTGLNMVINDFNLKKECEDGIYFCHLYQSPLWMFYSDEFGRIKWYWYANVTVPNDAQIHIEKDKFKVDKIILGEMMFIDNLILPENIYLHHINKHPNIVKCIPLSTLKSKGFFVNAIQVNPSVLKYASNYIKNEHTLCDLGVNSAYIDAMKKNGSLLKFVPNNIMTHELCIMAIKQNGLSLKFVPNNIMTHELCIMAIKQNCWSLKFVPEHIISDDLCFEAFNKNSKTIEYIPDTLKTYDMCCKFIEQYDEFWWVIMYIPSSFLNDQICETAVKRGWKALKYVPVDLITINMCKMALKQNWKAFKFIPENILTYDLLHYAIREQNNGLVLSLFPEHMKTYELCMMAIKKNGWAIMHVPREHLTSTMRDCALKTSPSIKESLWKKHFFIM